jgi:hypothetical protein
MKHSIILKVGENLIYQFSPQAKPLAEQSSSTVEFNRALPEWEQTAKSYLVKSEDILDLQAFLTQDGITTKGIPVPYEDMLIYADGLKNYAKYNKGGQNNGIQVVDLKPKVKPQVHAENTPMPQSVSREHRFFIEVAIDDENGEPYIIFKNDAPPNSMEAKIMKSFILKAKKDSGIEIKQGELDTIKIVLG